MTDRPETSGAGDTLTAVLEMKNEQIPHEIVNSETLEHSRVRYTLKVPASTFDTKVGEVLADLKKYVAVKGFRPGKAPMNLVRNQFGKHAREDAVRKIVPRLAELAAEEKKVDVLAQPIFESWEEDADRNAVVRIILEVRPEINVTDDILKDIAVEVGVTKIDDAAVDHELLHLQEANATYEAKDDAAFEKRDGINFTSVATAGGRAVPQFTRADFYTQNAGNQLPEAVIAALAGKKKGEEVTVSGVELPPNEATGLVEHADFQVKINEIKKRVLPKLDDEFAKDVSDKFQTLADLKAEIRKSLDTREEERRRNETTDGIYKTLRERLNFAVPPTIVEKLANNSINRMERQLNQYGMSLRKMERGIVDQYLNQAETEARVNAQNLLIADQIAKHLKIEATEERVGEEIARIAEGQGRKPLAVRAELEKQRQLDNLKADLRIKLTNDHLITKAKITQIDRLPDHTHHHHD